MKKQILFLAAMLIAMANVNATQWSVSNSAQNPGQFATIAAAIASASVVNGDTLLVQPTAIGYGAFTLNKTLTIIGGGFNTSKTPQLITNITGAISLTAASSGSRFYGLKHTTVNISGSPVTINNLVFEDCYNVSDLSFGSATQTVTNLVLRNCIVQNVVYHGSNLGYSSVITNCIITGNISSSKGNLLLNNCLFIGSNHMFQSENAVVQNCIFQNNSFNSGAFNNSFNNCFFVNVTGLSTSLPPLPIGNGTALFPGNTGANDSTMTTSPFVNNPNGSALNITGVRDYHVTGAALTYALDGGQIGLYGGNSTFSLKGEPLNSAIIRSFTINNAVVPVNGNLNINLMVTKPVTQ